MHCPTRVVGRPTKPLPWHSQSTTSGRSKAGCTTSAGPITIKCATGERSETCRTTPQAHKPWTLACIHVLASLSMLLLGNKCYYYVATLKGTLVRLATLDWPQTNKPTNKQVINVAWGAAWNSKHTSNQATVCNFTFFAFLTVYVSGATSSGLFSETLAVFICPRGVGVAIYEPAAAWGHVSQVNRKIYADRIQRRWRRCAVGIGTVYSIFSFIFGVATRYLLPTGLEVAWWQSTKICVIQQRTRADWVWMIVPLNFLAIRYREIAEVILVSFIFFRFGDFKSEDGG